MDSSQPFSDVAQTLSFSDYIRWALRKESGSIVIRDYQVVHLSDASWRGSDILKAVATQADLGQARRLLSDWGTAGIVEEFELSTAVFQSKYGKHLPELKFLPKWDNATSRETAPLPDRLDQLRKMLGDDLYNDFMEANSLDLDLYAHAQALLHREAESMATLSAL